MRLCVCGIHTVHLTILYLLLKRSVPAFRVGVGCNYTMPVDNECESMEKPNFEEQYTVVWIVMKFMA